MEACQTRPVPEWVRSVSVDKFERLIWLRLRGWSRPNATLGRDLSRMVAVLERLPETPAIARALAYRLEYFELKGHEEKPSQEDRDGLMRIMELLEKENSK